MITKQYLVFLVKISRFSLDNGDSNCMVAIPKCTWRGNATVLPLSVKCVQFARSQSESEAGMLPNRSRIIYLVDCKPFAHLKNKPRAYKCKLKSDSDINVLLSI